MDTPANVGKLSAFGQMLRDADVSGSEFAAFCIGGHFSPGRLAAFLEAIAEKDRSLTDTLLRGWGVR